MHGLLAPVLAQIVTLGLAERLEARYIVTSGNGQAPGANAAQVAPNTFDGINTTTPAGALSFDLRRASITIAYAPRFTLVPLFETPRELLVLHRGLVSADYHWRRTTFGVGASASYGERDFQLEALMPRQTVPVSAPTTQGQPTSPTQPGQTPPNQNPPAGGTANSGAPSGTGSVTTPTRPTQTAGPVYYAEFRTFATLEHAISRPFSLRFAVGYYKSGAIHEADRINYPISQGPDTTISGRYTVDSRNIFTSNLTAVYTRNELGNKAFYSTLSEDYSHKFSRHTTGIVGAGVSFGRTEPAGYLPLYSIYPTFRVGIAHSSRLARGVLTLTLDVNSTPAMDLNYATVDPRIGTIANIMWARDRFSIAANAASTLSITRSAYHTFDSILTSLTAAYNIGAGFSVDAGSRTTWQRYDNQQTIPQTWVFFAGISYNFSDALNPPHHAGAGAALGAGAAPGAKK